MGGLWQPTKPVNSSLAASAEMRSMWSAIEKTMLPSWVQDGQFMIWAGTGAADGDTTAPSCFTLNGAGAAIARCGAGLGDTEAGFGLNPGFVAKVTYGSAPATLEQTIIPAATFPLYYRSKTFVAAVGIKTVNINQARLELYDGVSSSYSLYHGGGGAWGWFTVQRTLDAAATQLVLKLRTEVAGSAYWHGACGYFGEIPPQAFVPCPVSIVQYEFPFAAGAQAVGVAKARWVPYRPGLVKDVVLHMVTLVPTGADLIVDVNTWDGAAFTSMYTAGGRPRVVVGANGGVAAPDGTYARRCLRGLFGALGGTDSGRAVEYDIDQVGSTQAGSGLLPALRVMHPLRPQEWALAFNTMT